MGTCERRRREKAKRSMAIVDAAERVFFSKGFDQSTVDDIAEEAELAKGTLYLYFKTKKELCLAIILRALRVIHARFKKTAKLKEITGVERIQKISEEYVQFHQENPNYYQALLNHHHHKACLVESQVLEATRSVNEDINALLEQVLSDGVKDGSIVEDVDVRRIARSLWGDVSGMIPGFILDDGDENGEGEQVKRFFCLMDLICVGLSKQTRT